MTPETTAHETTKTPRCIVTYVDGTTSILYVRNVRTSEGDTIGIWSARRSDDQWYWRPDADIIAFTRADVDEA